MANREESYPSAFNPVFVQTSIDTRLVILAHVHESISDFREKLYKEHKHCYPEVRDINISALKVKREGYYYRLPDSMNMNKVFVGISTEKWFLYVDVERVENGELMAIMPADRNPELLDKKEVAIDSVLVHGHTKALTIEEGLKTKVVVKKTKKRKNESLDGKKSRKKSKIILNQSAVATTPSRDVVDESHELGEKNIQVEVAMTESLAVSPRDKSDDILPDIESGEKNGISMGQTSDADMPCQEKSITNNSERVYERTRDEVKDAQANQIPKEAPETDESQKSSGKVPSEMLDDLTVAMEQDHEEREKTAGLDKIDQEKELAPISNVTESHEACPEHCDTLAKEKLDDLLPAAIEDDIERGEGSTLAPGAADNLQTTELATYLENQLEDSSGLTAGPATEKRRKRKKSSKDDINQSTATTTPRETVNEINEVTGNVDRVDATSESLAILERGNLGNPLPNAMQKENEMGEKIDDDAENQLGASSGLISVTATEKKKKKRKKSLKDHINQSTVAATTVSREVVNEREKVSDHVDTTYEVIPNSRSEKHVNPLEETIQYENEMGYNVVDKVGSMEATPNGAGGIQGENNVQVADLPNNVPALVQESKTLDHVGKSMVDQRTLEHEIAKDNDETYAVEATSVKSTKMKKSRKTKTPNDAADEIQAEDTVQVADLASTLPAVVEESKSLDHIGNFTDDKRNLEHEVAKDNGEAEAKSVKSTKKKKSRKTKTPNDAEEKQAEGNVQAADLATTLPALVQESKTLDNIRKFTDDKKTPEEEAAKVNGEIDAADAESVKSNKMKSSRKTAAKEDTLVDSGPQNVEPFKAVDGVGPDNVIRNVLDSMHQRNETQESLDKVKKKESKKSKKRPSSNIVDSQVVSVEVNNDVQEAFPPINTDASWTSVKENTERDALQLKNRIEDPYLSQQTQKEKADMGGNFGSRQKNDIVVGGKKQDKVTGGDKSKKEKKSLDLHPSGSIDGSLSSMKPKERNSRAQLASSGTSQLKSRLKNDCYGSKVDDSITSVKKSSSTLTVNKNNFNFFKDDEEWNTSEDESKRTPPHVSTKPSPDDSSTKSSPDSSSDDDSDVTSMSRKQGNNLPGGAFKFSGSLQDILRSSRSYKKAKETASQYMSDDETKR